MGYNCFPSLVRNGVMLVAGASNRLLLTVVFFITPISRVDLFWFSGLASAEEEDHWPMECCTHCAFPFQ